MSRAPSRCVHVCRLFSAGSAMHWALCCPLHSPSRPSRQRLTPCRCRRARPCRPGRLAAIRRVRVVTRAPCQTRRRSPRTAACCRSSPTPRPRAPRSPARPPSRATPRAGPPAAAPAAPAASAASVARAAAAARRRRRRGGPTPARRGPPPRRPHTHRRRSTAHQERRPCLRGRSWRRRRRGVRCSGCRRHRHASRRCLRRACRCCVLCWPMRAWQRGRRRSCGRSGLLKSAPHLCLEDYLLSLWLPFSARFSFP